MPCLILTVGLIVPRVLAVVLYLTGWFEGIFNSVLWPILGFLFMPTTLIAYGFIFRYMGGNFGPLEIGLLVIAVLIDIGPAAGHRKIKVAK
jgi:hypothetical protein